MEKIYSMFYSGGFKTNPRKISLSNSQPTFALRVPREIYPIERDTNFLERKAYNDKLKILENKLIKLEKDKSDRQNRMLNILYDKMEKNNSYSINENDINNMKQTTPIILPPIPIIQPIPIENPYSTLNPYIRENKNSDLSDLKDYLNNQIYNENMKAINSIDHLKNDYINVTNMLEGKIDQINHQQQLNYELLRMVLENKQKLDMDNSKNLELRREKELENLRNINRIQERKIHDLIEERKTKKKFIEKRDNDEPKIIEKVYPLVLEENEIDNFITGLQNNRRKGIGKSLSFIKKNNKKFNLKLQNSISQNEINSNDESENAGPKAKFLIRSKTKKIIS